MAMNNSSSNDADKRVVQFRRSPDGTHHSVATPPPPPDDLNRYQETSPETDADYRHRMVVNLAAVAFLVLLIGGAFWLADSIFTMRKNQDCVLTGRRTCNPIDPGSLSRP
ncbi:MAG: hypothetical protein ACTHLY_17340 [Pseudolabrys sp.]